MLELNRIHCGDNCDLLGQMPRECVDLVVTSRPMTTCAPTAGIAGTSSAWRGT